jgi:signal transduction histidine kinase
LQHNDDFKVEGQSIEIDALIHSIINQYSPLIEQRGSTINLDIKPCTLLGSQQRFELIFSNLVSNAIKYSTPKNEIQISLSASAFKICNATNLPDDTDIDTLFLPFHRADKSRSRQDGSTGLGLSIVKQILDQYEFDFQCQIKDGIFCIYIQFKP